MVPTFRPVQTREREASLSIAGTSDINPYVLEEDLATSGDVECSISQPDRTARDQRIGYRYTEAARQVVVTRSSGSKVLCGRRLAEREGSALRGKGRQCLESSRHVGPRQPVPSLSPDALNHDESPTHQSDEMAARCRGRDAGLSSQVARRMRLAVKQQVEQRCPGPVSDQRCDCGDITPWFDISDSTELYRV